MEFSGSRDTVSAVMTRSVHVCGSFDTLADVARVMWQEDIGAMPVVDENGQTIGMITDREDSRSAINARMSVNLTFSLFSLLRYCFSSWEWATCSQCTWRGCKTHRGNPVNLPRICVVLERRRVARFYGESRRGGQTR